MWTSVNVVLRWTPSKPSRLSQRCRASPTFAAKPAFPPPSGFKLFEDANFVPSFLANNDAGGAFI